MNPLALEIAGAVARWLLQLFGAYLVAHHVLTADQSDRFATAVLEHILLWLPAAAALAWSVWSKYRARLGQLALNELPAGASAQAIKDRMADFTVAETLRTKTP